MLKYFLLLMIIWGIFISIVMTFAPSQFLRYVQSSRMWMWYLKIVFGFKSEMLGSAIAIKIVRTQGVIGTVITLLALFAWIRGPVV
jgi:hypothetical protein